MKGKKADVTWEEPINILLLAVFFLIALVGLYFLIKFFTKG